MLQVQHTNIHVPTTFNDDNSVASTMTSSTASITVSINTQVSERQRMLLMDKYLSVKTTEYNKSTLQSVHKAVQKVLLPTMKCVSNSKSFATFEHSDFQMRVVGYIESLMNWEP